MNKIQCLVLLFILLFSVSFNAVDSKTNGFNQTNQNSYPSKITPFNISTTLYWTPNMIDQSEGSQYTPFYPFSYPIAVNGSFGPLKGERLQIYSTLFPMYPDTTSLQYSIQITNLKGPSNVSLSLEVSQHMNEISYTPENGVVLNSSVKTITSGSIDNITEPNLSYASVLQNITSNWAYSTISLQPISNDKNQPWNHTLIVKVNLSGTEDRVFFNYMRTTKGYPAWTTSDFTPLTMPEPNSTDKTTKYSYLEPNSQPELLKQSPNALLFMNNESNFTNKIIEMNLQVKTDQNLNMEFILERYLELNGYKGLEGTWENLNLNIPIVKGENKIQLQVPWQKMNKLNLTVFSMNKTAIKSTAGTYLGNYTGYTIFNTISIIYESLRKVWNASVVTKDQIKTLNAINLQDNTMNLTLNGKNYLITYGNNNTYDMVYQQAVIRASNERTMQVSILLIVGVALGSVIGGTYLAAEYRSYKKEKQTSKKIKSFKSYLRRNTKKEQEKIKTEEVNNILQNLEEIIAENKDEQLK